MATISKTQQIAQHFRSSIVNSKLVPGQKLPREKDMVSLFNVSQRVVREAMLELASEGLIERRQGSGTYVSSTQSICNIAVLVRTDHLASPYGHVYQQMLTKVMELVNGIGFRGVVVAGHGDTDEKYIRSTHFFDKNVIKQTAGVISLVDLGSFEQILDDADIPTVSIAGIPSARHSVVFDYPALAALGCEELRKSGYEDIFMMHFDYPISEEYANINKSISELGVRSYPVPFMGVSYDYSCEYAYEAFKQVWKRPDRPRAIFFYDEVLCDIATRGILELGIKVPDELAIITQSSASKRFQFPVSIARVEFDIIQAVTSAWIMLNSLIADVAPKEKLITIKPRFLPGQSL